MADANEETRPWERGEDADRPGSERAERPAGQAPVTGPGELQRLLDQPWLRDVEPDPSEASPEASTPRAAAAPDPERLVDPRAPGTPARSAAPRSEPRANVDTDAERARGAGAEPRLLERDGLRLPLDRDALQALIAAVLRHGWTILGCVAATLLAVVLHARLSDPSYVARTSVVVKLGREFQHDAATSPGRSGSMYRLEEAINSVIEVFESRGLVAEVVDDLSVAALFPDLAEDEELPAEIRREKAIAGFRERLQVRGIADSSVIEASFEHPDRSTAIAALDALVAHLGERQLAVFSGGGMDVLLSQLERVEEDHRRTGADLRAFQQRTGVFDVDHQVQILLSQRSQAEQRLDEARLRLDEIERALPAAMVRGFDGDEVLVPADEGDGSDVDALTRDLPSPLAFKDNRALAEAHAQLLALQVQARQLAADYSPDSRRLTSMREEMALLRDFLFGAAQDELEGQRGTIASLEVQVAGFDAELNELLELGNSLRELQSQHDASRLLYEEYLTRVEEARVDAELDRQKQSSIAVLDPASAPLEPIGLSLGVRMVLGLMVGLSLGLFVTIVRSRFELFA